MRQVLSFSRLITSMCAIPTSAGCVDYVVKPAKQEEPHGKVLSAEKCRTHWDFADRLDGN